MLAAGLILMIIPDAIALKYYKPGLNQAYSVFSSSLFKEESSASKFVFTFFHKLSV
jgi:hypothetical protein